MTNPVVRLTQAPTLERGGAAIPNTEIIAQLGPAVTIAVEFHRLFSAFSLFLLLKTYILATVTASTTLLASRVIAVQAYHLIKSVILRAAHNFERLRKSRSARRLRKRLENEIAMLILGPSTNTIITTLLWPGWLVIGALAMAGKLLAD